MITTNIKSYVARTSTPGHGFRQPFAILLCGAVWANFIIVAGHDRQRSLEIVVLLFAAALMLIRRGSVLDQAFAGPAGKMLGAFFILGAVSSATAFAPHLACFEVSVFFLLYLFASMVGNEIAHRGLGALTFIPQAIAATGALYVFKFFVAYLGALSLGNALALDDFTPGFSNIRFFNHTQTATLPLLILLCCLTPRTAKLRWLWFAVTTYWWMALFATMGRGTLMGMLVSCALVAALGRAAIPYLKQVAWTAAAGLLAYFLLLVLVPALAGGEGMSAFSAAAERTAADPASGRMFLWRRAASLIAQHPFLGVGPMHFAHNAGDLQIGAHPHDWLMQIGSEWGLPALACLLAALVQAVRALWRAGRAIPREDKTHQTIFTAVLAGVIAILTDGLVSGLFVMPQSQLAITLFLGYALGWYRTMAPRTLPAQSGRMARLAGLFVIVAAMGGIAGVWPDMMARLTGQPLTATQQAANSGVHWPRLWETGYF